MAGRRLRKLQFRESLVTHRHGERLVPRHESWNRSWRLFPDNKANEHFRELLARMPTRFGLRIHAYVLMGNHYHLQIERLRPNLSRAIQWLNLSFSAWYNRLHHRRGPLFQGRFKAVLHDPQESALMINRYIHLNPVRIQRLGGHEGRSGADKGLGLATEQQSDELLKARVQMLNSYITRVNATPGSLFANLVVKLLIQT